MEPHQVDDYYVRSHNNELYRINRCARCKPRIVTVLDRHLHVQVNPRRIVAFVLVIMAVFILVLVLPYWSSAQPATILAGLMQ
jgi:hypothetical protein